MYSRFTRVRYLSAEMDGYVDRVNDDGSICVHLDEGDVVELYPNELKRLTDRLAIHFVNGNPFLVADRIKTQKGATTVSLDWTLNLHTCSVLQWGSEPMGTSILDVETDESWERIALTVSHKLLSRGLYLYYQYRDVAQNLLFTGSVMELADLQAQRQITSAPNSDEKEL
jgi:hypothetical protein